MDPNWIGALSGAVGTLVAIGAGVVAARANARSTKANEIAQQALEAQTRALPAEWASPERVEGSKFRVMNTSGRTIRVSGCDLVGSSSSAVFIPPELPTTVQHGDVVIFNTLVGGQSTNDSAELELIWTYEGESQVVTTVRRF